MEFQHQPHHEAAIGDNWSITQPRLIGHTSAVSLIENQNWQSLSLLTVCPHFSKTGCGCWIACVHKSQIASVTHASAWWHEKRTDIDQGWNGWQGMAVDPNLDPELALALRVSLEEERARQQAAAGPSETAGTSADTPAPAPAGLLPFVNQKIYECPCSMAWWYPLADRLVSVSNRLVHGPDYLLLCIGSMSRQGLYWQFDIGPLNASYLRLHWLKKQKL